MKVFHLIKSLGRGGAERLLPETLRVHDRKSFEFAYGYFLSYKDQLVPELERLEVPVYCFASTNTPAMLLKTGTIARMLKDWGADLIHAHLPMAGVVARRAGRRSGIPVVYTEHNVQERYHPLTRRANLWTIAQNDRIICVSEEVANSLRNRIKKRLYDKIRTLPNGVNTDRFSRRQSVELPEPEEMKEIDPDALVIGTVAVFRKQKRLDRWIDLAKKLDRKFDHLEFVLVGDGPEEEAVETWIRQAGLSSKVHLPGRLDEVRPWLNRIDIYLMTSEHEGLPIALLEAMSMERPVVASEAGGISEVISSPEEGFLVPSDQVDALYDAVCRLIGNKRLRAEMGLNARQRIIERFSIQRMAGELEEIYRELIQNGKS